MHKHRRLLILLAALACTTWLAFTNRPMSSTPAPSAATPQPRAIAATRRPVPVVHKMLATTGESEPPGGIHRNPFRFTDAPEAPKIAPPPPPPPPPPPEIKLEARLLGTVHENATFALFSYKGDVLTLKVGDPLEARYLIKSIEFEAVVIEDRDFHNTATLTLPRGK